MESQYTLASSAPFEWLRSGGHLLALFLRAICRRNSAKLTGCARYGQITLVACAGSLAAGRGSRFPRVARGGHGMKPPINQPPNAEWEETIRQRASAFAYPPTPDVTERVTQRLGNSRRSEVRRLQPLWVASIILALLIG